MSVSVPLTAEEALARLLEHRMLGKAPRQELEWLAARVSLEKADAGEILVHEGELIPELWILVSGHLVFYMDKGSGRRKVREWRGGDVGGVLPYSRLKTSPGEAVAQEPVELLHMHRDHLAEMIQVAPTITAICVHEMLDRARDFTTAYYQDEKMVSLGKLSAGLAHELNNPASAAARSAKQLRPAISEACDAAHALGAAGLAVEETKVLSRVCAAAEGSGTRAWSAVDRADRQDAFEEWLEQRKLDPELAAPLVETSLETEDLDELAEGLSGERLAAAVRWLAAEYAARSLAVELERASSRVSELVAAVKRFTYMGRAGATDAIDIAQGVRDTIAVMGSKIRGKSATVRTELAPDLPPVAGLGGELNQVWLNLLDNALDAIETGGTIVVRAFCRQGKVVVEVVDDGKGIAPDMLDRIFDQFFTTKSVGEGTGLGLDIARRLVRQHAGEIEAESTRGHTVFRVTLPPGRARESQESASETTAATA